MRPVDKEKICEMQKNPENIRNICIMAHVDHGKTTLADSLVASNGIISQKMVGKLRYMDSRKDEQERGITMKSSSISLIHVHNKEAFLINLIDSPGHVDFSSEVSTAVRLCDGAIIVVDVVEGVCAQTKVVLRQAWLEHIKPILVFNKIDRLILEMKFQPLDAYFHMVQLLEQVNAQVAELFTIDVMSKNENTDSSSGLEDADDSNLYFSPEHGNVIFASAMDGWGFTVLDFARMFASKLEIDEKQLEKSLWGNNFYSAKKKVILTGAQENAKKPLFVQIVLENLWHIYDNVVIHKNQSGTEKIVKSLQIDISQRELNHSDPKVKIQAILSKWLPLSETVLTMICKKLPSPLRMNEARAEKLMSSISKTFDSLPEKTKSLKSAFMDCSSSDDSPVIAFISKMTLVDSQCLPKFKPRFLTNEDLALRRMQVRQKHAELMQQQEQQKLEPTSEISESNVQIVEEEKEKNIFVAFARVFSGTLRKGMQMYVLGPKYDPSKKMEREIDPSLTLKDLKSGHHVTVATVSDLYLFMGRELESMESIPAGCIVGIGGLEDHILKSGTLSSTLDCPAFTELSQMAVPIVRVAIEPVRPTEMQDLIKGLKLLNQADPCVQVLLQETGEHVLITAGEVHLQRCLKDLRENYAKIEINASEPIVPFRETIISPLSKDSESADVIRSQTPNKRFSMAMRAVSLPSEITSLLEEHVDIIKMMRHYHSVKDSLESALSELQLDETSDSSLKKKINSLRNLLNQAFITAGWGEEVVDKILSFGPRRCGPNLLINKSSVILPGLWDNHTNTEAERPMMQHMNSFINGFQMACLAGPLCEEPLMGVCFIVEDLSIVENSSSDHENSQLYGPLSGQIMSAVKDGCRRAFQSQPQRLMAAMYKCALQVSGEVVGKIYGVLSRRHGRVLEGDLTEGSASFSISAVLPVVESFNLANEIRKQASGLASHQLTFSHWEVIETDPFWTPTTEEELELFGDKGDSVNRSQIYMNAVRRRKGLPVLEKVVEFAEKQRTLSRKV